MPKRVLFRSEPVIVLDTVVLQKCWWRGKLCFYQWVQHYAPELEKRCKPHLKAITDSWHVDEIYVKVKKVWMYLYRAVDSQGNTLFL